MFYVYVLQNGFSKELYYGYTNKLERRVLEHKSKNEDGKLVYYEAYLAEEDARIRERSLKYYGQSRTHLKNRFRKSLVL